MQDPNVLLTILGKMAQKPEVKFDRLFPKLYNVAFGKQPMSVSHPNQAT